MYLEEWSSHHLQRCLSWGCLHSWQRLPPAPLRRPVPSSLEHAAGAPVAVEVAAAPPFRPLQIRGTRHLQAWCMLRVRNDRLRSRLGLKAQRVLTRSCSMARPPDGCSLLAVP